MQTTTIRQSLYPVSLRSLNILFVLTCLSLMTISAYAQQAPGAPAPVPSEPSIFATLVSLDAKKTTLLQVLDLLMKQANANYTLDSRLEDTGIGAVRLHNLPFRVALETVIKASNSPTTYRYENDVLMVIPKEEPAPEPAGVQSNHDTRRVTVVVDHGKFYDALKLIFSQAKVDWSMPTSLKDVPITVSLHNVPFAMALQTTLKAYPAPLTYTLENGIYHILFP